MDWFHWGELALARARELNKPILLSIGYSACHWCHVLAHESFDDAGTAQLDQAAADREKSDAASVKQMSVQAIPADRYGDSAEFANVAAFLVSERAGYVTVQITRVGGGFIRSL